MKESAKALKDNDVVEHIFYHKWIAGGNGTHGTHYYITRGRVGARKREKDAEERNNRNYSRITAKKKKSYKKKDIRKKQEDLLSTARILVLSSLTVDYSIWICRINTEWIRSDSNTKSEYHSFLGFSIRRLTSSTTSLCPNQSRLFLIDEGRPHNEGQFPP
ncbi:hypothetical protein [Bacteroides ovatus]|uniref:hypothetical protein n=1 Tax=Bacteroides ovatus TaxID=28116 RepID=UPI001EE77F17|nr:hypothetical protein [Bacteroides ovatus]